MANLFSKNHNKRTRFTRMCIGEAVYRLMDKKDFREIKVSDIAKKAGVSRMTFYHYYETKEEALEDYFHEIVAGYIRDCLRRKDEIGSFHDRSSILHALNYFDRYEAFIMRLVHAKLYYIIIDGMNEYMTKVIMPVYHRPSYELIFYGGALLNVFIQWQEGGKQETAEEVAEIIADSIR
ncbi:MAG: TetR/AcrR family transcriptional regulator [Eubacteriales bacterium]|nr:TetR/AcrR family transcriptional regulator [Eubacteriales bacterium]